MSVFFYVESDRESTSESSSSEIYDLIEIPLAHPKKISLDHEPNSHDFDPMKVLTISSQTYESIQGCIDLIDSGPSQEPAQRGSALRIPHASSICAMASDVIAGFCWGNLWGNL